MTAKGLPNTSNVSSLWLTSVYTAGIQACENSATTVLFQQMIVGHILWKALLQDLHLLTRPHPLPSCSKSITVGKTLKSYLSGGKGLYPSFRSDWSQMGVSTLNIGTRAPLPTIAYHTRICDLCCNILSRFLYWLSVIMLFAPIAWHFLSAKLTRTTNKKQGRGMRAGRCEAWALCPFLSDSCLAQCCKFSFIFTNEF